MITIGFGKVTWPQFAHLESGVCLLTLTDDRAARGVTVRKSRTSCSSPLERKNHIIFPVLDEPPRVLFFFKLLSSFKRPEGAGEMNGPVGRVSSCKHKDLHSLFRTHVKMPAWWHMPIILALERWKQIFLRCVG